MAHKKGQGSSRNGRDSNGQRRGVKRYGGEKVIAGNIIVRQLGTSNNAFTAAELSSAIKRLTKLDFQLKDSGFPAPLALSLAVQQIASRRP